MKTEHVAVAAALAEVRPPRKGARLNQWRLCVLQVMHALQTASPTTFDRDRFYIVAHYSDEWNVPRA